ncbi:MAG: 50S ribosomal protein L24 [Kiritimatiellaeota bacterium]|nr:50S ribosomal protein L24 [Kiritimatiellota bacterium]
MSVARIKKNDTVIVISGDYAGQTGKVLRVDAAKGKVVVEGVNMVKKSVRRSQSAPEGGFLDREAPMNLSKVMPYDPDVKKGVRVSRVREGGTAVRKSKATGKPLA